METESVMSLAQITYLARLNYVTHSDFKALLLEEIPVSEFLHFSDLINFEMLKDLTEIPENYMQYLDNLTPLRN